MKTLEPEAAFCVGLREKHPKVKFSTKALVNGKQAYGAKALRPGFAWHESMDLAWAVGFPHMTILVEGSELDDRKYWRDLYFGFEETYLSPACVMARVHQSLTEEDPSEMSEQDLAKATKRRELAPEELAQLVKKWCESETCVSMFAVEALVGPDVLAECVVERFEKTKGAFEGGNSQVLDDLLSIIKRVHADRAPKLLARIGKIKFKNGYDKDAATSLIDPMNLATNSPDHMSTPCGFRTQHLDGHPEVTMQAVEANRPFGGSRIAWRVAFTGTEDVFDAFVEHYRSTHQFTRNLGYADMMTSIRTARLLPAMLGVAAERRYASAMRPWFARHKEDLLEGLQAIGKKKGRYRDAANDMLQALGEKPAAPLVPREQQKPLNPPENVDRSLVELAKLDDKVRELKTDRAGIKKAFKATIKKIHRIAEYSTLDHPEVLFAESWAEAKHEGLTKAQRTTLAEIHDELVQA